MFSSGTYSFSFSMSTRTEWRWLKVPRRESWPDSRTGMPPSPGLQRREPRPCRNPRRACRCPSRRAARTTFSPWDECETLGIVVSFPSSSANSSSPRVRSLLRIPACDGRRNIDPNISEARASTAFGDRAGFFCAASNSALIASPALGGVGGADVVGINFPQRRMLFDSL
jgi:hypothetical protein